jgi:hypothetical protein
MTGSMVIISLSVQVWLEPVPETFLAKLDR